MLRGEYVAVLTFEQMEQWRKICLRFQIWAARETIKLPVGMGLTFSWKRCKIKASAWRFTNIVHHYGYFISSATPSY
jgi:hypothetical protein